MTSVSLTTSAFQPNKNRMNVTPCIYLVLCLSMFTPSCKGSKGQQGKNESNVPQESTIESTPIPNEIFVPLYYEGQLCHWVRRIFQDKNGDLWFGTNHYGAIRYNGETVTYFTPDKGFGGTRVSGIVEDKDGNVWFGNSGGITKYDPSTALGAEEAAFTTFTDKEGLTADVWTIAIDSHGTIWIGTSEGAHRFDGKTFTTFPVSRADVKDAKPMISKKRISSILEDRNGDLWFGTDGYGISKYDGTTFTYMTKENGLPDNNIADLMEDRNGNIWIGTMYGGVSMYNGTSFNNFTKSGVVRGNEVSALYEDRSGNIWFSAENIGVYRYDGENFANFHEKEGLATNGIQSIFMDKEGRFWFGGWKGLFRYDGKSFTPVTSHGPWDR